MATGHRNLSISFFLFLNALLEESTAAVCLLLHRFALILFSRCCWLVAKLIHIFGSALRLWVLIREIDVVLLLVNGASLGAREQLATFLWTLGVRRLFLWRLTLFFLLLALGDLPLPPVPTCSLTVWGRGALREPVQGGRNVDARLPDRLLPLGAVQVRASPARAPILALVRQECLPHDLPRQLEDVLSDYCFVPNVAFVEGVAIDFVDNLADLCLHLVLE